MDMAVISGIFLGSAVIIALLILLMTFDTGYLKWLAGIAAALLIIPLIVALIGNALAWFKLELVEILLLRQGAFSVAIAASYGVMAGVILNYLKIRIIALWRNSRA